MLSSVLVHATGLSSCWLFALRLITQLPAYGQAVQHSTTSSHLHVIGYQLCGIAGQHTGS